MKNVIQFTIEKEKNGRYIASGVNTPIVTDGKNFEELQKNIKEAVSLYLDECKKDFVKTPAIIANLDLSNLSYAQ